jgi:hypothetical protein
MQNRDATGRVAAVSVEAMQAVLERRGSEETRVRTLDAIMRDQDMRADFEILCAAYEAAPQRTALRGVPYAIAAALILFVGTQVWVQMRTSRADALRGSTAMVTVLAPGTSAPAGSRLHFTWHRVPDATDYALQVVDTDGSAVYSGLTRDTTLALPDGVGLRSDREYRWWVEANRSTGGPLKSAVQALRVTR